MAARWRRIGSWNAPARSGSRSCSSPCASSRGSGFGGGGPERSFPCVPRAPFRSTLVRDRHPDPRPPPPYATIDGPIGLDGHRRLPPGPSLRSIPHRGPPRRDPGAPRWPGDPHRDQAPCVPPRGGAVLAPHPAVGVLPARSRNPRAAPRPTGSSTTGTGASSGRDGMRPPGPNWGPSVPRWIAPTAAGPPRASPGAVTAPGERGAIAGPSERTGRYAARSTLSAQ